MKNNIYLVPFNLCNSFKNILSYFKARSRLFSNSTFSYACGMTICNAVVVDIEYISIS